MTTINHAVGGGLLYGWIAYFLRLKSKWTIIALGCVLGALPDVLGWHETAMSGSWQFRNLLHDGWVNDYLQWTLVWGLHTFLDRFIHPYPDHVLLYIVFEITTWVLYAITGYILYNKHKEI